MVRNISAWHIIIVLVVILLLFGANRLPAMAKSVGQSLKIFKNEVQDLRGDDDRDRPAGTTTAAAAPDPVTRPAAERTSDVPPPPEPGTTPRA